MPLVIPPGFAHCAVQLLSDADPDPWYVTFGIDISGEGADLADIGFSVTSAFAFGVLSHLHNSVQIMGVELTVGQDGLDPVRRFVPVTGEIRGESSVDKLPQNCAMLVKKSTDLGGRRQQGRFFVPNVVSEGQVSNTGVIAAAHRVALQSSINDLLISLAEPIGEFPSCPMVLLHGTEGPGSTEPTPVTALTVDGVISTQRRRLR